jgi:membrane protease YdiL (CAAX protease family)
MYSVSWSAPVIAAEVILLFPLLALAFAGERSARLVNRLPAGARIAIAALAVVPYYLVTHSAGDFRWPFALLYAGLPVILVALLRQAAKLDPEQRGNWRDFAVLAVLGVVVEFHLLESAWPAHLGSFNRLILLDTGLYGFLAIRRLTNVGFNFVPRLQDVKTGHRELAFYAPIAIPLGLGLGFLHFHADLPSLWKITVSWISIFAFIAVLEETYFRGWVQNLLERRIGKRWSLLVTAVLFGLSHFNKGATHFNWRYVLLATFAGIFYGRAWRERHRLVASAITHASVDTIWLLWLR